MTNRGGGAPITDMAFAPRSRMDPPPRSLAADAYDCIMVPIQPDRPNTSLRRNRPRQWQVPLGSSSRHLQISVTARPVGMWTIGFADRLRFPHFPSKLEKRGNARLRPHTHRHHSQRGKLISIGTLHAAPPVAQRRSTSNHLTPKAPYKSARSASTTSGWPRNTSSSTSTTACWAFRPAR